MFSPSTQFSIPRSLQLALFVTGVLWLLAAHALALRAAEGILNRIGSDVSHVLLAEAFYLFLLLLGFTALNWIATRQGSVRQANALPRRSTASREWGVGAAIGWMALLAALLPMMLVGALHPLFLWSGSSIGTALLSLLALAVGTLATEVAFRGFVFRRLIGAVGPVFATLALSLIYAILAGLAPNATAVSFIVAFVAGVLFSLAFLRTHALWLGWGMHFAWAASTALLFGLPVGGVVSYAGVVQTEATGPDWLTGGAFGPDGALFTIVALLLAMLILYRATRDYAWNYTHETIVPGGYPLDVKPPAAHTAMEEAAAARPAPLVQIAPVPSAAPRDDSPAPDA